MKYYKQETGWTCGAAAMRMVLEELGIRRSEKQVVRILKTNKIRGTWHKDFPRLAEVFKLNYVVERNSSVLRLQQLLKEKYLIIICYLIPKENVDHYVVIERIYDGKIYYLDPWYGEHHSHTISYFKKVWKDKEHEKRWLVALKK